MSLFNYECDEVKRIIQAVSPNYPQLTTYEKEWIYFYENGYMPGAPVELEYKTVMINPTGSISNAIPFNYKSAILKGQTLVNSRGNTVYSDWSTTDGIEYIVKGTNSFLNFECTLLPNTKYLTFFEFDGRGTSVQFGTRPANNGWDSVHTVTTDGICKKVITTGSDSKWLSFIVPNSSPVTDYVKISRIMIIPYQDGMENWDIPYFEGMKSVQKPVLTTSNEDGTKTNILTVNEDVTLRSNGDVYDELNLLTGRLTQRIDENNEVLAQEVVKTVDLTPLTKPYEGVNHYHLTSNIPCESILEVPVVSTGEQTLQEIINY